MPDEFADNGKSCKAYTEGRGGYEGREATRRRVGRRPPRQLAERGRVPAGHHSRLPGNRVPERGRATRARATTRPRPGTATRLPALVRDMAPRGTTPGATAPTGTRTAVTRDRASPPRVTAARGMTPLGTQAAPGTQAVLPRERRFLRERLRRVRRAGGGWVRPTAATRSPATRRPAQAVSMDGRRPRPGQNSFRRTSQRPGMITRRGPRAHTGGYPFSRCSTIRRRNSTGWRNAPPKEFALPSPTRWFMSSTWCPRRQCSGSSTRFTATARLLRAMSSSRIFSVSSPIAGLAFSRRTLSTCG